MIRPLFLSHGAPTILLERTPARSFLTGLAATMERPRAILMVSAHWETRVPCVNAVATNVTIHDFYGFPPALHALAYPAPGDPALAEHVAELIGAAGLPVAVDPQRGLDHGAWVPLMLAWPEADIPVLQLSVQGHLGPGHHLELGRALSPLASDGILVVGSGSFTHDLSHLRAGHDDIEPAWVSAFAGWMHTALMDQRTCDLLAWRNLAPHAARNHPTDEHLLPLFVALGAAGPDAVATRLHASTTHGVLRMDAYAFDNQP